MPLREVTKKIMEIVGSAPTVSAKQAHLDWIMDKLREVEGKLSVLESENISLLRENRELQRKINELEASGAYLDLGCCALKPKPNGGYFDTPHCPSCKKPLAQMTDNYVCAPCRFVIPKKEVDDAIKRR